MSEMSDMVLKIDDDDFTEAYRLAMESVIASRGGDRSIVYKSLMANAPAMGMTIQEADAVYEGKPGSLMWTYGLWHEIDFLFDEGDDENFICLYHTRSEYDAEQAFNRYYQMYKPDGAPDQEFKVLSELE